MTFYNDVKEHLSPSALDMWLNNRSAFVKTYFEGEKFQGNAATRAGKSVHALIEGGMLEAKHCYNKNETQILVDIGDGRRFLGIPDSYESQPHDGHVSFVDYKTGKENGWKEKLPSDVKMKATAWLVWKVTGEPKYVHGWIEYWPTEWDAENKEVRPIDGAESEEVPINYDEDDLRAFTMVILKAMDEINEAYVRWQDSTGEFVNQEDVEEYVKLDKAKREIETRMTEIKERIMGQMEFGGKDNVQTQHGSFYVTTRKTYEYPPTLKVNYLNMGLVLEDVEAIDGAMSAAKKNWERENEPKSVSRTLGFRQVKEK